MVGTLKEAQARKRQRKAAAPVSEGAAPSSKNGFTLIELLIVLTILAILVAVVTISLTQFVGTGEEQACDHDKKALQESVLAFYTQGTDWPTALGTVPGAIDWGAADENAETFTPDYVLETPNSQADCDWSLDANGVVIVGALGLTCPCD